MVRKTSPCEDCGSRHPMETSCVLPSSPYYVTVQHRDGTTKVIPASSVDMALRLEEMALGGAFGPLRVPGGPIAEGGGLGRQVEVSSKRPRILVGRSTTRPRILRLVKPPEVVPTVEPLPEPDTSCCATVIRGGSLEPCGLPGAYAKPKAPLGFRHFCPEHRSRAAVRLDAQAGQPPADAGQEVIDSAEPPR